ncbi:MAG: methyltransferase, partial [Proteobacteria bacterium]
MSALADQYRALAAFLKGHEAAWLHPILPDWPRSRANYSEGWLLALGNASLDEQRLFEDVQVYPGMSEDLRDLVEAAGALTVMDGVKDEWPLDRVDLQGLNLKKQHEIQRLLPLLSREAAGLENAVDIGGGMGHLARICVKNFHWNFHSIDRNPELQEKGRWWRERSRTIDKSKLNFVEAEFSDLADEAVD